jgi:DNA-binding NarL/FixJ family response regulator
MSGRVLIVDDDPAVRESVKEILERKGITVAGIATDGREGAAMAAQLKPDVVLMDRLMPGVDGVEATRRIVAEVPGTQVIMLSAHVDAELQRVGEELGVYCFLAKGCSDNLLTDMVGRAVAFKLEMAG